MTHEQQNKQQSAGGLAGRLVIVAVLAVAVAAAFYARSDRGNAVAEALPPSATTQAQAQAQEAGEPSPPPQPGGQDTEPAAALPRLVDLGADKCIPCKMMAPILEELGREYAGRFEVRFIDVWKNPSEAEKYGVRVIPTQIFYDAGGKELLRHQGFFAKEDVLKAWLEHGLDFGPARADSDAS